MQARSLCVNRSFPPVYDLSLDVSRRQRKDNSVRQGLPVAHAFRKPPRLVPEFPRSLCAHNIAKSIYTVESPISCTKTGRFQRKPKTAKLWRLHRHESKQLYSTCVRACVLSETHVCVRGRRVHHSRFHTKAESGVWSERSRICIIFAVAQF